MNIIATKLLKRDQQLISAFGLITAESDAKVEDKVSQDMDWCLLLLMSDSNRRQA